MFKQLYYFVIGLAIVHTAQVAHAAESTRPYSLLDLVIQRNDKPSQSLLFRLVGYGNVLHGCRVMRPRVRGLLTYTPAEKTVATPEDELSAPPIASPSRPNYMSPVVATPATQAKVASKKHVSRWGINDGLLQAISRLWVIQDKLPADMEHGLRTIFAYYQQSSPRSFNVALTGVGPHDPIDFEHTNLAFLEQEETRLLADKAVLQAWDGYCAAMIASGTSEMSLSRVDTDIATQIRCWFGADKHSYPFEYLRPYDQQCIGRTAYDRLISTLEQVQNAQRTLHIAQYRADTQKLAQELHDHDQNLVVPSHFITGNLIENSNSCLAYFTKLSPKEQKTLMAVWDEEERKIRNTRDAHSFAFSGVTEKIEQEYAAWGPFLQVPGVASGTADHKKAFAMWLRNATWLNIRDVNRQQKDIRDARYPVWGYTGGVVFVSGPEMDQDAQLKRTNDYLEYLRATLNSIIGDTQENPRGLVNCAWETQLQTVLDTSYDKQKGALTVVLPRDKHNIVSYIQWPQND